ncbi:outer membrane transport energization protein TonB [Sinobacterium caligoides]|uniref:Outer membrane transport energization protein TonB n=1 Tax=Sinobacterium caligoides TaxID=933926 RepID=A0A3N2DKZ2_9GAMM|nr:energy transducer TonB [Sinobacterium caligoides]ROS00349.1 outer membrane transport energization protein TonB [Sinobacterium caligoides]
MIIRAGCFASAIAIHGLLWAAIPEPQPVDLLAGGGVTAENIAISVSYQQSPTVQVNDQPKLEELPQESAAEVVQSAVVETKAAPKEIVSKKTVAKKKALEKTVSEKTVPKQVASKKKLVVEKTLAAKPVEKNLKKTQSKTKAASASVAAAAVKRNEQGVHQEVISEPLFADAPVPPVYPRIARKRGQEGTVWIDIALDDKGRQTRVEIYKSSGVRLLDRAALKAVQQWQFLAQRVGNTSYASLVRIPVEFSLD